MNIQEYISSGIVESYVLGLADKDERAEFERMCAAHPEVRNARDSFEMQLERHAVMNAIEPPGHVKSKIFAQIEIESQRSSPVAITGVKTAGNINEDNRNHTRVRKMDTMRYLVAASIILLVGSTALNIYYFREYKTLSGKYADLAASQQQLTANNQVIQAKLLAYESDMAIMKDPNMAVVKMPQVPTSPVPGSMATVYWDTRTKDVYLLVNNMPKPTDDKQYQLWALVDGKPVDAGVFDAKAESPLVKMKNIPQAQAFAITLEKKGGSASPTMDQMYVLGNVKT